MKLAEVIKKAVVGGYFRRPCWVGESWLMIKEDNSIKFRSTGNKWTPKLEDLEADDYQYQVQNELWEIWCENEVGEICIHPTLVTENQKNEFKNVVISKKHIITRGLN